MGVQVKLMTKWAKKKDSVCSNLSKLKMLYAKCTAAISDRILGSITKNRT